MFNNIEEFELNLLEIENYQKSSESRLRFWFNHIRDNALIDEMIEHILSTGLDTVIAAKLESGSLWQENEDNSYLRLDSGDTPRLYKEKSYIGLKGLCCITHTEFVRREDTWNSKIGLFEVKTPLSAFEVRSQYDRQIADRLLNKGTQ